MTYDTDFVAWTEEQAAILKSLEPVPPGLDVENLVDEILGLGRREIAAASDLALSLLVTICKISGNPGQASALIEEAMGKQGELTLACESGIEQHVDLDLVWRLVKNTAARSMGIDDLPDECPFSIRDLLDIDFDPVAAARKISATNSPSP
jgi:hypothetical protein